MSVCLSQVKGWLQAKVGPPRYDPEPDEAARDAVLLRMFGISSVVMLIVMTLIAGALVDQGDAWLIALLPGNL